MLIDGIHIPLTTPFTRDGRSYLQKLEHNVGRYSLTPAAGLVAMGPGSEANTLSDDEIAQVLQVVGRAAAAEKVLVAGIAKDSVRGALAIAEQASEAGFDAVLLAAPRDWALLQGGASLTDGELKVFFEAVADSSQLPVMLWSDAPELPVALVAELARHQNVIGVYDAGLTLERYAALAEATSSVRREVSVTTVFAPVTRRMLRAEDGMFVSAASLGGGAAVAVAPTKPAVKTRTKVVGFQIMAAGRCAEMLPLLQAGIAGAMPGLAACAPQGCYEVFAAFKDGDSALSAEKADRILAADELIQEMGVGAVKFGCDLNGYFGGVARLPRLALTEVERQRVEVVLREVRN
jgi:4-hydroxy-2-oxoglutarate aldolase